MCIRDSANFYKLSLNKGKYIVPISDEISHVTYYMKIQDLRFSGEIRFLTDIDPVILQYSIPKITLQPIVENALFHGILEKKSKSGQITIHGILAEDNVCLLYTSSPAPSILADSVISPGIPPINPFTRMIFHTDTMVGIIKAHMVFFR